MTPEQNPASADAMEALEKALAQAVGAGPVAHSLASIVWPVLQQYGDQREAAGFRRAVEAAAIRGRIAQLEDELVDNAILALLETQETRHD